MFVLSFTRLLYFLYWGMRNSLYYHSGTLLFFIYLLCISLSSNLIYKLKSTRSRICYVWKTYDPSTIKNLDGQEFFESIRLVISSFHYIPSGVAQFPLNLSSINLEFKYKSYLMTGQFNLTFNTLLKLVVPDCGVPDIPITLIFSSLSSVFTFKCLTPQ